MKHSYVTDELLGVR